MTLYHATLKDYSPGEEIKVTEQSSFYQLAVSALEEAKPEGSPSRLACVFASDDCEFCLLYAIKQGWPVESIRMYEVQMDSFHRSPMAIVHAVQRRLESRGNATALITEYWSPVRSWKFYECFAQQMRIIRQIELPTINETILNITYQGEAAKASSM